MLFGVAGIAAQAFGAVRVCAGEPLPPASPLRLSTVLGPSYPQGMAGATWAAQIGERTSGRIATKHFPGATLVGRDSAKEFSALRDGGIELAVGSASAWSLQVPALNVFALPWLVSDDAGTAALLAGDVVDRLDAALAAAGVVVVAWTADGFQQLATKAPARQPSDLKGARIRCRPDPIVVDTLAALGAMPTSATLADARTSLASGVLDGDETTIQAYALTRLDAAGLAHLQLWDAHADVLIFAMNRAAWSALSDADRDIVRAAAQDAVKASAKTREEQSGAAALGELGRRGVAVTRLTAAGKAGFRVATRAVYDKWASAVGIELVASAENALRDAASAKSPAITR